MTTKKMRCTPPNVFYLLVVALFAPVYMNVKVLVTRDVPLFVPAQEMPTEGLPKEVEKKPLSVQLPPQPPLPPPMDPKQGGVIFFLHIPKTGGTTIREAFRGNSRVKYIFVPGRRLYDRFKPKIENYIQSPDSRKNRILFIEIHGRSAPHLLELRDTLKQWKQNAQSHGLPTFFFTVLRDPMPYELSYFYFFHVGRPSPVFRQVPAESVTVDTLLQFALWNPQCQFMARGENSLRKHQGQPVLKRQHENPTEEECERVWQVLEESMDWVGTTERLDTDALPLVARLVGRDDKKSAIEDGHSAAFETKLQGDRTVRKVKVSDFNQTALRTLEGQQALDERLYKKVKERYPAIRWQP